MQTSGSRTSSAASTTALNEDLHRRLFVALGATPPEFIHHGLILGEDGKKLAKRAAGATVASLREAGIREKPFAAISKSSAFPSMTCTTTCRASAGSPSRRSRR